MMNSTQAPQTQHRPAFGPGVAPDWFHGIIPRKAAEELLMSKPRGYFLIRVSESRPGYTLSHRAEDRCRHFMIDLTEDGCYVVVGEQRRHQTLQGLVDFHRRAPVPPYSEVLTVACGKDERTDYAEILFPQRGPGPAPPEDAPPALPYRGPRDPEVQDPHVPSSKPDAPVPMPRKRYKANELPSPGGPAVPVRSLVPQPPQNQDQAAVSLPPAPSVPPPRKDAVCSSADATGNLSAKLSAVSNLKILNKVFQAKKEQVGEAPRGPRYLPADAGLPQEYLPPPPFAPGY